MKNRSSDPQAAAQILGRRQAPPTRRDRILAAALHSFARLGYDATTTQEIARAAGVGESVIFQYFATKADLLSALLGTQSVFPGEEGARLLAAGQARPARELLPELALAWLHTLRREAALTGVLFAAAQTNPAVRTALTRLVHTSAARLAACLAGRAQAGELRSGPALETAAFAWLSALLMFFILQRPLPDAEWEPRAAAFARELSETTLRGLMR